MHLPRRRWWALAELGGVCVVGMVIWGAAVRWRTEAAPGLKTGESTRRQPPEVADASRAAASDEAKQARQIKEAAAYWDEHKARLRQLLTVDYPAAVARRNAATPEFSAVEAFAKAKQQNIEEYFKKKFSDQEFMDNLPVGKILNSSLDTLFVDELLVRGWDDPTPVTSDLTMADLTREMWADPDRVKQARAELAKAERTVFHDETAAQKVEAMQTAKEMVVYAKAAQARYRQATAQELDAIGGGEQVRAALTELDDIGAGARPVETFLTSHNREVAAILDEYAQAERTMNEPELAQGSSEDAEARRLLTEWKDMRSLWQADTGGEPPLSGKW